MRDVAAKGLWLLPVYALLLAYSTIRRQPSVTDFEAYARFTTTREFLLSHLFASIGGAALAILGVVAAVAFLSGGRARRSALIGLVLTVLAQVYLAAAFGSAAFVQPGLGRAYLKGAPGMPELNADTAYGPALFATAGGGALLLILSGVFLGVALARTCPRLRWPGVLYAVSLALFVISGFLELIPFQQPLAGLLLVVTTVLIALRLPRESDAAVR
jgi:hypothetical protein